MKRNLLSFLLIMLCFTIQVNAQVKKTPISSKKAVVKTSLIKEPVSMYKITDLSFFNSAHVNLIEKQIDAAIAKKSSYVEKVKYVGGIYEYGGMNAGGDKRFLDHEFRHLGNQWFFVDKYFGPNRIFHKEDNEWSASILENNKVNRALNDSIFIMEDGSLFNIYKNEYLSTEITTNKRLKIIDLPDRVHEPLTYGDGVVFNNYRGHLSGLENFNLLSDKFIKNVGSSKIPRLGNDQFINRFSNYILSDGELGNSELILTNRYNVEENLDLKNVHKLNFLLERNWNEPNIKIPATYNDSLFITSIRLDYSTLGKNEKIDKINFLQLAQLLANPNNSKLPFSLDRFLNFYDANEGNQWSSKDPLVQKKLKHVFENSFLTNYLKTIYFQNSFNKLSEDELYSSNDLEQKTKIADKFVEYIPEIVFVFNFRKNKVQLLKRTGLPFGKLKNLLLDRSNTFLVAQSDDSKFTIFDLRNGEEIVTLKGIINHISDENKLIVNLTCSETDLNNVDLMLNNNKINGYAFNLNELHDFNKVYYKESIETNNIDEFTTEADFKAKLAKIENENRLAFFNQSKNKNTQPMFFAKPTQPDNKTIHNIIENQIKKFIDGQGQFPADIRLSLKYTLWDPSTQTLKLSSAIDSTDLKYFKDEQYWRWVHNSDEEAVLLGPYRQFSKLEGHINGNSVDFEISPVDAENAKKVKSGSSQLTFIMRNEGLYIPKYKHIAYIRFLDKFNIVNTSAYDLVKRKKELEENYLMHRNSLYFFDMFFIKENLDEIPLKSSYKDKIDDGYSRQGK